MSKYIIEIAEEYEEYFKGVLICGIADGKFAVDVIAREDLEELNSDYINENFGELQDEAYKRGLEDGKKSGYEKGLNAVGTYRKGHAIGYDEGYEDGKNSYDKNKTYQRGLEDAWEAAKKLYLNGACKDLFGEYFNTFIKNHTAQEAIAKLKAYEDKRSDRIEVGDEVRFLPNDRKGIVTACHVPDVYAENDKYAVFCGTTMEYVLRPHITKTGKHYDIASILEAMRE